MFSPFARLFKLKIPVFAFLILCLSACTPSHKETGSILAEAYGKKLLYTDLQNALPHNLSEEDSVILINSLINKWIEERVLLEKAEFNIDEQTLHNINSKVEDYRNSLLIFAYEKELLKANMDTSISLSAIKNYYNENLNNFILDQAVVKCIYFKVNKTSPSLKEIQEHYRLKNTEDSVFLSDLETLEQKKYAIDPSKWHKADILLEKLPLKNKITNEEVFLNNNKYIQLEDSSSIHLLNILEFKKSGETAPLDYVKDNIVLMLRNHKKREIISSIRKDLIELAISQNDVIIHN